MREAATAQASRAASYRLRPVGRGNARLDCVGERRQRSVRLVLLDDERAVRERDEVDDLAAQTRRGGGRDGIPAPGAGHAVNPRLPALFTVPSGRLTAQPGGDGSGGAERELARLCELLVQRLSPPEETHVLGSVAGSDAVVLRVPAGLDPAHLAVALDLALELVDQLVDRRLHVG